MIPITTTIHTQKQNEVLRIITGQFKQSSSLVEAIVRTLNACHMLDSKQIKYCVKVLLTLQSIYLSEGELRKWYLNQLNNQLTCYQ